jgi:hypothetical protein
LNILNYRKSLELENSSFFFVRRFSRCSVLIIVLSILSLYIFLVSKNILKSSNRSSLSYLLHQI